MTIYRVADLFCGAGGFSTGAQRAIRAAGADLELVAVNHWPTAIATHSRNHPHARHTIADVSAADPYDLVPEGQLDLLLASPECVHYSRARGGKPFHNQGRMNPWVIHDWLTKLDVQSVIIENVPEFTSWGPLTRHGRLDPEQAGQHFQAWFLTLQALGYQAQWRILNAADYGAATSRRRFFLIAHKGDQPVAWPEPTHAAPETQDAPALLQRGRRWRPAREIIDWNKPGSSLLDDPKYRRRPLSLKTRQRIAHGFRQYGGDLAPLFIPLLDLPAAEPEPETAPVRAIRDTPQPFLVQYYGCSTTHSVERPLSTVTTIKKHGLAQPVIVQVNHGNGYQGERGNHRRAHSIAQPLPTITTIRNLGLATPAAVPAADAPLDPRRLVQIDGRLHQLDIRYRMLSNRELAHAMGFDEIGNDYEFAGNQAEVTKQIGNAVPVPLAEALVAAVINTPPE